MEHAYLTDRLTENMNAMLAQSWAGDEVLLPYSATMRGYRYIRGSGAPVPAELADLAPGLHELESVGRDLHVLVTDESDRRYILTYDAGELERIEHDLERWLLIGLFFVICSVTAYGVWMSSRIVRPIRALANAVDSLDGGNVVLPPELSGRADDEVAKLASTFHSYSVRLRNFMDRERNFTADVSHELRNPVMAASNALELLESRDDLDQKAAGQLARVRRSVERMQELIQLFLSLSQEPVSSTDPEMRFDIVEVTQHVVADYQDAATANGQTLGVSIRCRPLAAGDVSVAGVVLENLIGNAVQYARAADIEVVVDADGVSINDSGPGMLDTEQPQVMRRFVRGGSGELHRPFGMGLGLSIVARLCEHQGWTLDLDSAPGRGMRVAITFSERHPT